MDDALPAARQFAESLRFSGDLLQPTQASGSVRTQSLAGHSLLNELEISSEVTPALSDALELACKNLSIPASSVHAFVYPDAEHQATCEAPSTTECVLRFSSGLVDLLEPEEFAFVCGHELGHFLLGHGTDAYGEQAAGVEYFMAKRAQEISVDRLGLIACQSLDVAIRTLMKTTSGLSSQHLRFDVGRYIAQLSKLPSKRVGQHYAASHPSMLVRCRALLWFSLSDPYLSRSRTFESEELEKIDVRIRSDLDTYVDAQIIRRLEALKLNLGMWMAAKRVVNDGVFRKSEQEKFSEMFGTDALERMRCFLADAKPSDLLEAIAEKIALAKKELGDFVPNRARTEMLEVSEKVAKHFN